MLLRCSRVCPHTGTADRSNAIMPTAFAARRLSKTLPASLAASTHLNDAPSVSKLQKAQTNCDLARVFPPTSFQRSEAVEKRALLRHLELRTRWSPVASLVSHPEETASRAKCKNIQRSRQTYETHSEIWCLAACCNRCLGCITSAQLTCTYRARRICRAHLRKNVA